MKYSIYEHFYSWQGEGFHIGKSSYFIRTYGCPLQCSWCDSANTWNKKYLKDNLILSEYDIYNLYKDLNINFVTITGGEPSLYNWSPVINLSKNNKDIPFHIETSGSFKIKGNFDWITVSPKWNKIPLKENLEKSNEIKIIVEDEYSIEKWIKELPILLYKDIVWLNPVWHNRENKKILNSITQYVKTYKNFRAGFQIHKLYKCDNLDVNSKDDLNE